MAIKKLVAVEYEVTADQLPRITHEIGEKYSYFLDEETGKVYRPKGGLAVSVNSEELLDMFAEVETQEL